MKKTKISAMLLAIAMTLSLAACGGNNDSGAVSSASSSAGEAAPASYSIAALKGPTAMGLVKLMKDAESGEGLTNQYTFSLAASADEVTPKLIQGELDMACVPANLAAVLYQKTEGQIETLAVNTLGVLYIVENGNAVQSMSDLRGMTVVAAGKGSTPEYALRYLLRENGVDPDKDVTIDWKSEHSECVTALASGEATVALLPQPFVTVAQSKLDNLRVALDLTEEWDKLDNGSGLITGVIVARKDVVDANPTAAKVFLQDYAASVDWVNENVADAAQLIGDYDIVDAAVAEKALPACNIVCITGSQMHDKLSGYLSVLFDQNPQSVGGALPEDDFYFGA
jgi:NitT/TauT family transport system substrate-binding protein